MSNVGNDQKEVDDETTKLKPSTFHLSYILLSAGIALLIMILIMGASYLISFTMEISVIVIAGLLIVSSIVIELLGFRHVSIPKTPHLTNPDDLGMAVEELAQNYELSRTQTNSAFILSAIFMGAGLIVILFGSISVLIGKTGNSNTLSIVAGVISEFISGGALALYRSNFNRLNDTSSRLYDTWKIFAAYKLTTNLSDSGREAATLSLISALAGVALKAAERESANGLK